MEIKPQLVTAIALIKAMDKKWRIDGGGGDKDGAGVNAKVDTTKVSLSSVPGVFNGTCYKCGER